MWPADIPNLHNWLAILIATLAFAFTIIMAILNFRYTKKKFRRSNYPSLHIGFGSGSNGDQCPAVFVYSLTEKPATDVRCAIHFKKGRAFPRFHRKKVITEVKTFEGTIEGNDERKIIFRNQGYKKILTELSIGRKSELTGDLELKVRPFLNELGGNLLSPFIKWIDDHFQEPEKNLMSQKPLFYRLNLWLKKRFSWELKANPKKACLQAIVYVSWNSGVIGGGYILVSKRYILSPNFCIKVHVGFEDFVRQNVVSEYEVPKMAILEAPYFDLPFIRATDSEKHRIELEPKSIKIKFMRKPFRTLAYSK